MENISIESRLQKCESDYEQRLSIANDQVESLQKELHRLPYQQLILELITIQWCLHKTGLSWVLSPWDVMEWYSICFSLRPPAVILIKSSLAVPWKHPLTSLMVFFSLFSHSLVHLEYLYKSWVDKWYDHCYIFICLITLCAHPFLPNQQNIHISNASIQYSSAYYLFDTGLVVDSHCFFASWKFASIVGMRKWWQRM